MSYKRIIIWDLDETLVDSAHRVPKDSLLPLMKVFSALNHSENYVAICTARAMNQDDYDFLAANGISAHCIMCRPADGSENHIKDPVLKARKIQRLRNLKQFNGLPVFMFDESSPVIRKMRSIGVHCFNAIKLNKKLGA